MKNATGWFKGGLLFTSMVISIFVSLILLSEDDLPETIRAKRQVNYETGHQRRNPARSQSDYGVQRHGPASVAVSRDTAERPKDEERRVG